jgi:RNA polymerase sigma-54 factor
MTALRQSPTVELQISPQLAMRPSPALVATTALLALAGAELEQAVERELRTSPALERVEWPTCGACGRPLALGRCARCHRVTRMPGLRVDRGPTVEDAIATTACAPTLTEALLPDVAPLLGEDERPIADYLLGSINPCGRLETTVGEVALAIGATPATVTRVLEAIQAAGPPGFAARSLRECLLLQLDRIPAGDEDIALARRVVDDHLDDLGVGRYGRIARALGVSRVAVLNARDDIAARLEPFPGLGDVAPEPAPASAPDLAVLEDADGLAVEVIERGRFRLTVSEVYERALAGPMADPERETVAAQLDAARSFIDRLEQRWNTMRAVAEIAVGRQRAYVRGGRLLPLTRAEVAGELGLHESTVSRAVAGRNLLLPSGRIVSFASLFGRSPAPQEALAELIAAETEPMSDAELADELHELGFALARRTVAKYREQLGIRQSSQRRPAKLASR